MQSMMADLGVTTQVRVWTDSIAANARVSRRGLGKTRHVELRYLWLQEVTKSGRVKMRRIPGEQNLANHLTKVKAWHQIETLIRGVQSEESCRLVEMTKGVTNEVAGRMRNPGLRAS